MPDPAWSIESGSEVNAEGNLLTLNVKVTTTTGAFNADDHVSVLASNTAADNGARSSGADALHLVQGITGWGFDGGTGELVATITDGKIAGAGISDFVGPIGTGGLNYYLTFKYRLALSDSGRIAINNGLTAVTITSLLQNWMVIQWKSDSPHVHNPLYADPFSNVTVTPTKVGKLPAGGGMGSLLLNVDAHAEGVAQNGGVTHMATWSDLSAAGNTLTGNPSSPTDNRPALTAGDNTVAKVDFHLSVTNYFADSSPPVITSPATIAAVILRSNTTGSPAHIVGRRDGISNIAWQLYYAGGGASPQMVYKGRSGSTSYTAPVTIANDSIPIFFVFRRKEDAGKTWEAWINGSPAANGTFTSGVNTGDSELTLGARSSGISFTDSFTGQINQVALYDTAINDLELSLLMHQMADRVVVNLGTPIPSSSLNQPYITSTSARHLDRRPIALIRLAAGLFDDNVFGQRSEWRNLHPDEITIPTLSAEIAQAIYGCDQFEIMFSRPGGQYSQDPVMTYVFGQFGGEDVVYSDSWYALKTIFDNLNLSSENDDQNKNAAHYTQRRAWLYTGGGMPLDDAGALDTTGYMRDRQIGPATPAIYKSTILDPWIDAGAHGDDRYRCFFLDAAAKFYGQVVAMVHDATINSNFILVGEAIPTDPDARLGAPWFSRVGYTAGPWWNVDPDGVPQRKLGYNPRWEADWETMPTYFGVQSGEAPDLYRVDASLGDPGLGSNLKLGDIYKWSIKGAVPVSMDAGSNVKVGTAWNYATGRVMPSRLIRCPRLIRSIRC